MAEKKTDTKIYRLKPMVIARLLSELTVAIVIITLCILCLIFARNLFKNVLFGYGYLLLIPVIIAASIFSLSFLYIVYEIRFNKNSLETISLAQKSLIIPQDVQSLKTKQSLSYRSYVISDSKSSVSFSMWFDNINELIQNIKLYLPKKDNIEGSVNAVFKWDKFAAIISYMKILISLLFITVLAAFAMNSEKIKFKSLGDKYFLIVFVVIVVATFIYKNYYFLIAPFKLVFDGEKIRLYALFYKKEICIDNLKSLQTIEPIFGEGVWLATKNKEKYLLNNNFFELDEMVDLIQKKIK